MAFNQLRTAFKNMGFFNLDYPGPGLIKSFTTSVPILPLVSHSLRIFFFLSETAELVRWVLRNKILKRKEMIKYPCIPFFA